MMRRKLHKMGSALQAPSVCADDNRFLQVDHTGHQEVVSLVHSDFGPNFGWTSMRCFSIRTIHLSQGDEKTLSTPLGAQTETC